MMQGIQVRSSQSWDRGHWPLWLLTAALLIWLAGLGLLAKQRGTWGYRSTGDELFDRYARLVLSQRYKFRDEPWLNQALARLGLNVRLAIPQAEALDFSALREWEHEFGDDPRYWELRAGCSMNIGADTVHLMRKKMLEGIASSGMLRQVSIWELLKTDPGLALKLADSVIAAEADNSFAYYLKGDLLYELGRKEAALESWEEGNLAVRNEMPLAFPMSFVAQQPERFSRPDERLLSGYTWAADELVAQPNFSTMKKQAERIGSQASQGGLDEQLACAYWRRAARAGSMENSTALGQLVSTVLLRKLVNSYESGLLSETASADFQQIDSHLRNVRAAIKARSQAGNSGTVTTQGFGNYSRSHCRRGLADYQSWRALLDQNHEEFRQVEAAPFAAWNQGEGAGYMEKAPVEMQPEPTTATPQSAP